MAVALEIDPAVSLLLPLWSGMALRPLACAHGLKAKTNSADELCVATKSQPHEYRLIHIDVIVSAGK